MATGPSNSDTAHHAKPLRPLPWASPALMSDKVNQPTAYWVGMAPIWIAAIIVIIAVDKTAFEDFRYPIQNPFRWDTPSTFRQFKQ